MAWRAAIFVLRIAFGGMFVYAGAIKARDPLSFVESVRGFRLLHDPWNAWVAMGLPWLEIFCGACVLLGLCCRGALTILCAALVTFTLAIANAWRTGLDITCGCFGEAVPVSDYRVEILTRLAMLAVGCVLLIDAFLGQRPRHSPGDPAHDGAADPRA